MHSRTVLPTTTLLSAKSRISHHPIKKRDDMTETDRKTETEITATEEQGQKEIGKQT